MMYILWLKVLNISSSSVRWFCAYFYNLRCFFFLWQSYFKYFCTNMSSISIFNTTKKLALAVVIHIGIQRWVDQILLILGTSYFHACLTSLHMLIFLSFTRDSLYQKKVICSLILLFIFYLFLNTYEKKYLCVR